MNLIKNKEDHVFELTIRSTIMLPNFYNQEYRWLRKLDIVSSLIINMNFLDALPYLEHLMISSKNLKEISNLGGLQYLNSLNLDNCDIKCIMDYPSYLKLVKLYSADQEDTDSHHFYNSKLLIGRNTFQFIPIISKHYPIPSLKNLASLHIRFNDLDDDTVNLICSTVKLNNCDLCRQIRSLNDFWVEKAIGFIICFVKCKLCYRCLVKEYKKLINRKHLPFSDNYVNLVNDLNQIIQFGLLNSK
jgi:hypothetical protein